MIGMWKGSCTVDFHFPRTAFFGRYSAPIGFDDLQGIIRILQAILKQQLRGTRQNEVGQALDGGGATAVGKDESSVSGEESPTIGKA